MITEIITDVKGQVDFTSVVNLEAGTTYYYKEIEAPAGYILNPNANFRKIVVDN